MVKKLKEEKINKLNTSKCLNYPKNLRKKTKFANNNYRKLYEMLNISHNKETKLSKDVDPIKKIKCELN